MRSMEAACDRIWTPRTQAGVQITAAVLAIVALLTLIPGQLHMPPMRVSYPVTPDPPNP